MSTREGFFVLNSEIISAKDKNEHKVGRVAKVSGSLGRKTLCNITNLPQQLKPSTVDEKSKFTAASTKEYVNKLQKENMTLMKLLADRDKIVESSAIELQKLGAELHKMRQQNVQLAQSNTKMLADINLRKDRLKLLQHELGCKQGLLVAKKAELEVKMSKCEKSPKFLGAAKDGNRPCEMNRRQHSKSLDPLTVKRLEDKKRLCVRRQSARFKSQVTETAEDLLEVDSSRVPLSPIKEDRVQEHIISSNLVDKDDEKSDKNRRQAARFKAEEVKPAEDLFEIDSRRFPLDLISNSQIEGNVSTSTTVPKEDNDGDLDSTQQVQDIGQLSIGRPSRQVTKKVNSYKETPLNVKMRRNERKRRITWIH